MNPERPADTTVDLAVRIPGSNASCFVPGVNTKLKLAEVKRKIGQAWGIADVDDFTLQLSNGGWKSYIYNEAAWAYLVQQDFFRQVHQRGAPLECLFVKQRRPTEAE